MKKENVFMVSGRQADASGIPQGAVMTHVLCADDERSMRSLAKHALPGFVITSAITLQTLEQTSQKLRAVLARKDTSWRIFSQPGLEVDHHT